MVDSCAEKKKFKVTALGCRTNQYEAQAHADQLRALGWSEAQEGEKADLCIVNTCTVTSDADRSSRHQVRQMHMQHPEAKLVVTGCFAQRDPQGAALLPGVNLVVPNDKKSRLIEDLFPDIEQMPEFSITGFAAHTRAFIKIQDGCNSFCTYCIIPYVRGRSRSRSVGEILEEVKSVTQNGYKEIVLTGINIGDFDGG